MDLRHSDRAMLTEKLAAFEAERERSNDLPASIAPAVSSDAFRTQPLSTAPKAISWATKLSQEGRRRDPSTLKASNTGLANIISLGTARPAPEYSPWESLQIEVQNMNPCSILEPQYRRLDEPGRSGTKMGVASAFRGDIDYDLDLAMNYGYAGGSPHLLRFITEHVELVHNPPYQDWGTCLTCGTTSVLDIILRMLCNPGDHVLCESYTYSGMKEAAAALNIELQGVHVDDQGLCPEELDRVLREWDSTRGPRPFVLYTIPTGQNPTGVTQTTKRRQAIYAVAERHDLCVIEDDPYYYLHLDQVFDPSLTSGDLQANNSAESYLAGLSPSYLSLDLAGRVIRLDATSKILAPGLRCGWITAPSEIIARFISYTEFSTVAPSGPSQLMLYKLLDSVWGHEGFLVWLSHLSARYRKARDAMLDAFHQYLPSRICCWRVPTHGMFIWLKLDLTQHPGYKHCEDWSMRTDVETRIHVRARANGVQVSKGSWFAVMEAWSPEIAFRLTYAASSPAQLNEAVRRLSLAVKEEFRM